MPDTDERNSAPHKFGSNTDARAWLSGVRTDIQRGLWKHPKMIASGRFKPYAADWVAQRMNSRGEALCARKKGEYLRNLDTGLADFAEDLLSDTTPARVRGWHAKRLGAGKTTAAREARLLRAVLNTAIMDGLIAKNSVASNLAQSSAGKKYRPPTEDELAVILDVSERDAPRVWLAVMLAAFGGLRFSEWRALRRCDIQLDGDRFRVAVARQAYRTRRLDRTAPKEKRSHGAWTAEEPKKAEG